MLFEQIITDNTLLQPYEYINTEIAEDGHRLVLHLASRKDTATGLKPPRGLSMDTGMKTISSH